MKEEAWKEKRGGSPKEDKDMWKTSYEEDIAED